jgi:hypothetical protein
MRALGIGKKKIKSSFIDQELYTKMKETNKKKISIPSYISRVIIRLFDIDTVF